MVPTVLCDGSPIGLACTWAGAVIWRPILAPMQIVFFTVVLLALSVFAYSRTFQGRPWWSGLLLLMRLAAVLGLGTLLFGPSDTSPSDTSSQRCELAIVLDISDSMLTEDCQGQSRLSAARKTWLNPDQLARFNSRCDLELYAFAEDLLPLDWDDLPQPQEVTSQRNVTLATQSLLKVIRAQGRRRDAAILVLSDGHDTEDALPEPASSLARSRGIPLYTVAFGAETQQQDLVLMTVPIQDYLLPNEPGAILVKAYQFGLPDAQTTLRLKQGDQEQQVPLDFKGRAVVELQLEIRQPDEGQYEYQVSLDPVVGEVEQQNNRQTVFCEVRERGIRVLVLEGQPYWDTKFLAQSLRKDERIELTQITQVAPESQETLVSRTEGRAVRVPSTREQWAAYDVVILGQQLENLLDEPLAVQLRDYVVEQGGHLVFARGRCYDSQTAAGRAVARALRNVEPVVWGDESVARSRLELRSDSSETSWLAPGKLSFDAEQVFRELPGMQTVRRVERLKPATRVLADASPNDGTSQKLPALVVMPAGRGQIVGLLGSDSWRWSLRPPADPAQASFYDTFWSNLVRWLVMGGDFQPGQQVALTLSRQSLRLGDGLELDVIFKDPAAAERPWRVVWTTAAGEERELRPSRLPGQSPRFRANISPDQIGVHSVRLATPEMKPTEQEQKFSVYEMNLERLETSARPAFLRSLAQESGGLFLPPDRPDELLKRIERQQTARLIPPEPHYIWDRTLILVVLLSWIGSEWLVRRWAGLW